MERARESPSSPGIIRSSSTQIDRVALERGAHGAAVGGIADLEAFVDEIAPQHGPDPRLVIHDQDMHRIAHFRSVSGRISCEDRSHAEADTE